LYEIRFQTDRFVKIGDGIWRVLFGEIRAPPTIQSHGEGRIKPYNLRKVGLCSLIVLLLKVNYAEIAERTCIVGGEADSFIEFGDCMIIVFFEPVCVAANAVTRGAAWVEADRFFLVVRCAVVVFFVLVGNAAVTISTSQLFGCLTN
jgi:hypothetical protein